MAVAVYVKSGAKSPTTAKLDKSVFGVETSNHQLLKDAYLASLSNSRTNNAAAKRRGEVRGGGRKPWRQKGTGNARFGSIRTPLWRGGGVIFGPTGRENYSRKLNLSAKRQALRQALSLASKDNRIKVIESISFSDGKVKSAAKLLDKVDASGNVLITVSAKDELITRATRNIQGVKVVEVKYLNVYDILNADNILIDGQSLNTISEWLGGK